MRVRVLLATTILGGMLASAGCGGDNLELCDGCGTPTPTVTPTSTPTTPTPTLSATPAPTPSVGL
jgi:hypothetical protein